MFQNTEYNSQTRFSYHGIVDPKANAAWSLVKFEIRTESRTVIVNEPAKWINIDELLRVRTFLDHQQIKPRKSVAN